MMVAGSLQSPRFGRFLSVHPFKRTDEEIGPRVLKCHDQDHVTEEGQSLILDSVFLSLDSEALLGRGKESGSGVRLLLGGTLWLEVVVMAFLVQLHLS